MKPKFTKNFLWLLMAAGLTLATPCQSAGTSRVDYVSDGDTLILDNGQKVRLIGVDTPEIHDDDHRNQTHAKQFSQDPAVVDAFAVKAREFSKKSVLNQEVRLEYDWQRRDKFGRTLAYVYRQSDNFFLNSELIKQGYGFAYTRFPFKYKEQFKSFETDARRNRRGLWGS